MSNFVRTFKRRKKFLDELEVGSSESAAARAAGGDLRQFRKWRKEDPDFSKDWEDAIDAGTDFIEDVATDRALKKSDALMAMLLKARRPEKFDRGGKLELSGQVNVEGSRQKLLNRIARLQSTGQLFAGPPAEESEIPTAEDESGSSAKLLPHDAGVPVVRGRKRASADSGGESPS